MQFKPLDPDFADVRSTPPSASGENLKSLVCRVLRKLRLGTFVPERPPGYHFTRRQLAMRDRFPDEDWQTTGVPVDFVRVTCEAIKEGCDLPNAFFEPEDSLELLFHASHNDFDMAEILFKLGRRLRIRGGLPEPRRAYEENRTVADFVRTIYTVASKP